MDIVHTFACLNLGRLNIALIINNDKCSYEIDLQLPLISEIVDTDSLAMLTLLDGEGAAFPSGGRNKKAAWR